MDRHPKRHRIAEPRSTDLRPGHLMVALALVLAVGSMGWAAAEPDPIRADAVDSTATVATHAIPDLPFDDNPDPDACGIPQRWDDDAAWLVGEWEGDLIEPLVHLYDSHLRREVTGRAPSGTQVRVILFQDNPVLDFYLVEATLADGSIAKGWVPAPFLAFEAP